jgi:hypothetical protein
MSEMNELETHLRTWKPRSPSARLERKLFRQNEIAAPAEPVTVFRFHWAMPGTAALALLCLLFNQHHAGTISVSANSGPMVAMIMSNQSAAAYLPGSFERQHNSWGADIFDSTNGSKSSSSMRSLPVVSVKNTNE